ncbi:hypothetical protein AVEN_167336-1 [Araneus ventricosus]|uniref:Uncharacterized protein n=1 Tax=Araneus ventricosus TaxID=182803 RepID=A0A4Y2DFC7_ARAVE|nr:hypothetical protein AVEN_167336-1 [Araneus ventricosus]
MLQSALLAASMPLLLFPLDRLPPILSLPHTVDLRFLERAPFPPRFYFSRLTPTHITHTNSSPHTGDLSPARRIVLHFLSPNGMNGNPTTLELQLLPQSTPIIVGISH